MLFKYYIVIFEYDVYCDVILINIFYSMNISMVNIYKYVTYIYYLTILIVIIL